MKKRFITVVVAAALMTGVLAGCTQVDVVGKYAVTSFDVILNKTQLKVTENTKDNAWQLEAPSGEVFMWGKDYSTKEVPDLMMAFKATPFIEAGLDVTKLPDEMYRYDASMDMLMIHAELGDQAFKYEGDVTALKSFEALVKNYRDRIGYHEALDHYGVALGDGNMVEWAKDSAKNDKDLVFVLNPEALIAAGVDPSLVKDWAFAKVKVKNDKGEEVEVVKFLKPYNLD